MEQQIGLEEEPLGDAFVVEQFGDARVNREETVGWIHHRSSSRSTV